LLIVYRRLADNGAARCGSSAGDERMLAAMDRIGEQLLDRDWYIRALDRATGHGTVSAVTGWQALELPPARLESDGGATVRLFRFRPGTPLLGLSGTLLKSISVQEDGHLLRRASSVERVRNGPPGLFAIDADAIVFSATDRSDPRRNGRTYTLHVPAQIAALERFPPDPRR
jgi:hypothetical protein